MSALRLPVFSDSVYMPILSDYCGVMLSERSPGSASASRSIRIPEPSIVAAIAVFRLVGRRGDLLTQEDTKKALPSRLPYFIGGR